MKNAVIALLSFLTILTHAATFKYGELMLKDYDEMQKMVQDFIKKSQKLQNPNSEETTDATAPLRDALKLIFSRPDSDNMVAKLVPDVRRELSNLNAFEATIESVAQESLEIIKNKKAAVSAQSTSLFVLENILGEIHPELDGNPGLVKIVQDVAGAKIKISKEIANDRKLKGMFTTKNPSDMAKDMLKNLKPVAPPKK
jgi:hypothetical protein